MKNSEKVKLEIKGDQYFINGNEVDRVTYTAQYENGLEEMEARHKKNREIYKAKNNLVTSECWDKKYTTLNVLFKAVNEKRAKLEKSVKIGDTGMVYGTYYEFYTNDGKLIHRAYNDNTFALNTWDAVLLSKGIYGI